MITVFLYGDLKEKFGHKFKLAVRSPLQAVKLLEANFPGKFLKSLMGNRYQILRGATTDNNAVTESMLHFEQEKDIHFIPVIAGSKEDGLVQIIVGVIIVAAVTYATWGAGTGPATGAFLGVNYGTWGSIGASLIIGGVGQMLTPTPELNSAFGGVKNDVDPRKSSVFTGPENVSEQGVPMPVIYGEIEVGSIVASRSLTVEAL